MPFRLTQALIYGILLSEKGYLDTGDLVVFTAGGIVTEKGGEASHAAVVGLSLDIPVIVGAENAVKILKSGTTVHLDAKKGIVTAN